MVLTNFENSCWPNDGDLHVGQMLHRPKIDLFRVNSAMINSQQNHINTNEAAVNLNEQYTSKPISHLSSNGYYGFAHISGASNAETVIGANGKSTEVLAESNEITPSEFQMDVEHTTFMPDRRKRAHVMHYSTQVKRVRMDCEDIQMEAEPCTEFNDNMQPPTINLNNCNSMNIYCNSIDLSGIRNNSLEFMENLYWHTHGALLHQIYDADDEQFV